MDPSKRQTWILIVVLIGILFPDVAATLGDSLNGIFN